MGLKIKVKLAKADIDFLHMRQANVLLNGVFKLPCIARRSCDNQRASIA